MSSSRRRDGWSSTTIAMFCIASRNLRGIDASASATCFSNRARSTGGLWRCRVRTRPLARDHRAVILAVVANDALVAPRLRPADAAAVQNERIGRARPARLRHRRAQLLLDDDRIVGVSDADAVGDAEH